jgi:hypothetical protein
MVQAIYRSIGSVRWGLLVNHKLSALRLRKRQRATLGLAISCLRFPCGHSVLFSAGCLVDNQVAGGFHRLHQCMNYPHLLLQQRRVAPASMPDLRLSPSLIRQTLSSGLGGLDKLLQGKKNIYATFIVSVYPAKCSKVHRTPSAMN